MKGWMHTLTHLEIIIMFYINFVCFHSVHNTSQHFDSDGFVEKEVRDEKWHFFFLIHNQLLHNALIIDYKSFNFVSFAFECMTFCALMALFSSRVPAYTIKSHERTRIISMRRKCEFELLQHQKYVYIMMMNYISKVLAILRNLKNKDMRILLKMPIPSQKQRLWIPFE